MNAHSRTLPAEARSGDPAVDVRGLSRTFGRVTALRDVTLQIPQDAVLGLVGQNGAGKTTLIQHILGLLRAQTGTVRVFGINPVEDPEAALGRIGAVSEERDLPGWMTIRELLRYTRAFYPTWDPDEAARLLRDFHLDATQRVSTLSRGQHVRTSLVLALAHRPPLLVLDEPSSGLDPVVRRDVLATILETVSRERRAVLFSSHLLDEVERLADHLALLEGGELRFAGPTDEVARLHRHVVVRGAQPDLASTVTGCLATELDGDTTRLLLFGTDDQVSAHLQSAGADELQREPASLEEIFHAHAAAPSPRTAG